MPVFIKSLLVSCCLLLVACGSGGSSNPLIAPPAPTIALPAQSTPPIDMAGVDARFHQGIAYGPYADNVFDIFLPNVEQASELVVFIHGGGFTGGERASIYDVATDGPAQIRSFLSRGVAFASIDYRLLQDVDTDGVIKPLLDSARALQFMRYYQASFNIDKAKIAAYGGSAGAGTSLWLAFSDDMADSVNADLVLRESTRLLAAGAIETQGTYDIVRWETEILKPFGITLSIIAQFGLEQRLLSFNGVSALDDIYSAEGQEYRKRVDLLDLMSVDDAPMFIDNNRWPASLPTDVNALLHHPRHGLVLQQQAELIGLPAVVYLPELGISDPSGETIVDFLLRHLGV